VRRRFLIATLLVTVAALAVLGVPLGYTFGHLRRSEVLQAATQAAEAAARTAAEDVAAGRAVQPAPVGGPVSVIEVRLPNGQVLTSGDQAMYVTWGPVVDEVGGIRTRAGIATALLDARTHVAWLVVAALGSAGAIAAVGLALTLTSRVTAPFRRVAAASAQLGSGDFTARAEQSGIAELDAVVDALNASAERIGELFAAEQRFASSASHQLRTPLTSLRLRLEELAGLGLARAAQDEVLAAIGTADRLTATIDELVRFRKAGRTNLTTEVDLAGLVETHVGLDAPRFLRAGRRLSFTVAEPLRCHMARGAVAQALDVLVDNAFRHGRGDVNVAVMADPRPLIVVSDEGTVDPGVGSLLSGQSVPTTSQAGLGLALARLLVEAEGGHLALRSATPTAFAIVLAEPAGRATPPAGGPQP